MGLGCVVFSPCLLRRPFTVHELKGNLRADENRVVPVLGGIDTPEGRAGPLAGIPIGRLATPQDVANAACSLASDEASFLTVSLRSICTPVLNLAGSLLGCRRWTESDVRNLRDVRSALRRAMHQIVG